MALQEDIQVSLHGRKLGLTKEGYLVGDGFQQGLPTGGNGQFMGDLASSTDNITAHSGGGQANGVPITASMTRVTTVGAAGDSVTLPASIPGNQLMVTNAAAVNSMNVFPNAGGTGTEQINALGANAAFAVAAGKTVTFNCYTAGQWHTLLSA